MRSALLALALAAACGKAPEPTPTPPRPSSPLLEVVFNPERPQFHMTDFVDVEGKKVYDYSRFSVTIKNNHPKPIRMVKVILTSVGDREKSGLGDIKDYWLWPASDRTLAPGTPTTFNKVWGFTVDTPNRTMTYVFEFEYVVGDAKKTTYTRAAVKLDPD